MSASVAFRPSSIQEFTLRARDIEQTYSIRVFLPTSAEDDSERFPVVYVTDSDDFFGGFASMANMLHVHGETPRFILVGIGYDDARKAPLLRMRDLCTHAVRSDFQTMLEQMAESPLIGGVPDLRAITHTTDASHFLRFIRFELMPTVNDRYATNKDDSTFCGYSAGGGFGLFTLFNEPKVFKRYVIGSPSISYNGHHFGLEMAEKCLSAHSRIDASVFMSVGELEEFKRGMGQFDFVTGYYQLAKFLINSLIPGLQLTLRVFPGETHVTAWTSAFIHGMKAVLGPVENVPFWPRFLKSAER